MCEILIFGGTTEGRELAGYCHENGIEAYVSVVSDYGKDLLPESKYLHILSGGLTSAEMERVIRKRRISLVLDATHPYAFLASGNIKGACDRAGTEYLRVVRGEESADASGRADFSGSAVWFDTMAAAASYLEQTTGNILITTGSKELPLFSGIPGFAERVYARVLPSGDGIKACTELGLKGNHIIAMQGPFSRDLNRAVMEQLHIRYLVTKESGAAGGFLEKTEAAADAGVTAVIIGRPGREDGITVAEGKCILAGRITGRKRRIFLIGTGMGGPGQMTAEAWEAVNRCEVLFGAARMVKGLPAVGECGLKPGVKTVLLYQETDIMKWLEENPWCRTAGVLYSGDTGFYSGAPKLARLLRMEPYCDSYEFTVCPGISTLSFLCARLGRGWEHVCPVSLHGRNQDLREIFGKNREVFALLGGEHTVQWLCGRLLELGMSDVSVTAAERLSYPDERIITGSPKELMEEAFGSLTAVLIEQKGKGAD